MSNFFESISTFAQNMSKSIGIPASVLMSQLSLESANGTSILAKKNNLGGLSNFSGSIPSWSSASGLSKRPANEGGYYYNYNNIADFFKDYEHVLNLSYYEQVRKAGATPGVEDDVIALSKSPYAGSHYGGTGASLLSIINKNNLEKYDNKEIQSFSMSTEEKEKYIKIGLAVAGLWVLLKEL